MDRAELTISPDAPLAFVDVETTGCAPGRHRIIDVAVIGARARRSGIRVAEPGESGRARSGRHHGAHRHRRRHAGGRAAVRGHRAGAARAARGPRVRRAQRALRLWLHPARVRAHSAANGAAPNLCTVRLSRALYPEMPRHNLDAVMERHGHHDRAPPSRHARCAGAAGVLAQAARGMAARTSCSARSIVSALRATLPAALPPDLADDLPEEPGVYRFFGADEQGGDTLLYVGKANNLRERVLDHFRGRRQRRQVVAAGGAGAARGLDRDRGRARRAAARGARDPRDRSRCTTASCAAAASASPGCSTTRAKRRELVELDAEVLRTGNAFGT